MYYRQTEKFTFSVPREYKAYLAFKQRLKESGVTFTEVGGHMEQVIEIHVRGRFTVNDDGTFDKNETGR